ncbi:MAG: MBL fold metallo-hydrolase [Sulfuricurvum sp.]|uniref:MBL fold metallo-hydrolase n=1 Tax=Sulfuricurvum sp. TaxID=2025608 RepID=UPI0027375695|nr:MBL fold metallo-hydrolase [Sulfuricurvum sp.]MDP2851232.1 MBL fold metallo-hydrolase [Sulfuricurvum sp.]
MPHHHTSPKVSFTTILKWQFSKSFRKRRTDRSNLPILSQEALPEGEYALWLGHASLWLKVGETTVAVDPVLGNIPLYRRHSPLPIPKERLRADVILITHAHYDHYDKSSVLFLLQQNPNTIIVAPAGFWRYLKGKIARERCFELEWWESVMVGELFITFVPSKHWSNRTNIDMNKALWGGYVIQNNNHTLYHSGDSAMGEHFKEIKERFDINEAFLPIGAYRPEPIMRHFHISPLEALQAAHDLGAKTLIPIHYGTFKLADDTLDEPIEWFEKLIGTKKYPFESKILRVGEIYRFKTTSTFKST